MMDFFKGTVTRKDWMAIGAILGSTLLVAAVFVFLVHAEQQKKLASVNSELTSAQAQLKKSLDVQKNIDQLSAETEEVKTLVSDFEKRLPNEADMPQLLKDFEQLAAGVGLEVTLKSMDPVVDAKKETLPYSVVAKGTFHQITAFVNLLERYKRYLSISNLDISETDEKDGVAQAKFTLSTYSFKQPGKAPAAPPSGTTPAPKPGSAA